MQVVVRVRFKLPGEAEQRAMASLASSLASDPGSVRVHAEDDHGAGRDEPGGGPADEANLKAVLMVARQSSGASCRKDGRLAVPRLVSFSSRPAVPRPLYQGTFHITFVLLVYAVRGALPYVEEARS